QMDFIRKDFSKIRADIYPIRLWTVAVFLFGVLPIARKRKIGRILIGDEYDCTQRIKHEGITHYNGLFDQSKYFDNVISRYYMKKGWNLSQFSILRSLSELLIIEILVKRYPDLQHHQISCHSASEKKGRIFPCGNCEKCRRIVGMLKALDEDPGNCGYNEIQIQKSLKSFSSQKVKQIGSDASHLYYLLITKGLIEENNFTKALARPHDEIQKLRFDNERSMLIDIPDDIRHNILKIYLKHTEGAMIMKNRKWISFDVLRSEEIKLPYPFELSFKGKSYRPLSNISESRFLWEEMSWPEILERLRIVDTAILPCGAIEQHGPHLPVDIDYFDAKYLAIKVAEATSDPKPFVLPAIPYGVSYHHDDFKGTISVSNESLSQLIYDIGMSLARNGIKKLILLNGHGDNAPTLNFAAQMINRDAQIFVCIDTGETSDEDLNKLIETPNDIHAGEIETSTSLAIRPELVKMEKAVESITEFGSTYLDFSSVRGIPWYVRTKKLSETGIMGNPLKASPEKGQKIWEIMIAHLVKFVEDIKSSKLEELYQKRH
ncbi:creatininase family protein, partial [Bacteroidota bacterium]